MYGRTDSPLHGGIGTDPGADQGAEPTFRVLREGDLNVPGELDLAIDADRLLVPIPDSIQALKDASPGAALRWRIATRSVLPTYLERSYEAREFYQRDGWGEYLLERIT
jgi:predicted GNAT superfamily acetyltransferase